MIIDRGVSVVLDDTAAKRLHTTAEEFTARGARVLPVITDVSDAAAVDALASRTLDQFGRVDVVVNNAGIAPGGSGPLWRTDPQDWQRVLAVNLLGVVHGIQAFVPHLVTAGAGHVVNIASLAGLMATPFGGAYGASKHAVVAISETLRGELEVMEQLWAMLKRGIATMMEPAVAAEGILTALDDRGWSRKSCRDGGR